MSGVSNGVSGRKKINEIKYSLTCLGIYKAGGFSSCGIHLASGKNSWWRGDCGKATWRCFILVPTGFGWIISVRFSKDDVFIVLVGFWMAPCMRNGFGVLMRCFGDRFVILGSLMFVKELVIGCNLHGILWFGTSHNIVVNFTAIRTPDRA